MSLQEEPASKRDSFDETSKLLSLAHGLYSGNATNTIKSMKPSLLIRTGTNILAIIASIVALLLSIFVLISFSPSCIGAGLLQFLFAIFIFLIESPIVCRVTQIQKKIGEYADNSFSLLVKGVVYAVIAIIPICLCACTTSIIPGVLIAITAILELVGYRDTLNKSKELRSGNNV